MPDPQVPETLDGWAVLHQMFRIRWEAWRALGESERRERATGSAGALAGWSRGDEGATALVALIGHKGDLMLVHFRRDFESLHAAHLSTAALPVYPFLEITTSYVSVVELGMYEMTSLLYGRLAEKGLAPGSAEFDKAKAEEMAEQRRRVAGRLFPEVPARRHVCFYPMNKRRGEHRNWYAEPFEARARMMREHGVVGRRYAGQVTQVISGSIGFDDWEWGVDLFADDPLVFKKLVYEMRFDEASAWFAEFGDFYVGLQFSPSELPRLFEGQTPGLLGGG